MERREFWDGGWSRVQGGSEYRTEYRTEHRKEHRTEHRTEHGAEFGTQLRTESRLSTEPKRHGTERHGVVFIAPGRATGRPWHRATPARRHPTRSPSGDFFTTLR